MEGAAERATNLMLLLLESDNTINLNGQIFPFDFCDLASGMRALLNEFFRLPKAMVPLVVDLGPGPFAHHPHSIAKLKPKIFCELARKGFSGIRVNKLNKGHLRQRSVI